ncbi:aminotransferase class V-fold PLP-dependent enzyme [Paenibacillus xylaniclasticus]|uniref:aminotransferase class V-fold PLP-dependent enzyme n=1 Tax=Paenibacillus xylaniclasticus TaxID=588083 RepID=UPI00177A4401|nr:MULTISPECIES: aminotransferase class V-fold PLP-dependent enzyme [Paenibacillus]GFN33514.1 selenocysteine lyase [Paenibacillus curdlanolyticus]
MQTFPSHSFEAIRHNIIGIDHMISTPYGQQRLLYADWAASGRLYRPIEDKLTNEFGPMIANPHTELSATGLATTRAYEEAKHIIKSHVGATDDDVLLFSGPGMTSAVCKFQRLLGLKQQTPPPSLKPIVFVTHMEHHSNHTTWTETNADVVVIPPDEDGRVSSAILVALLHTYRDRPLKYGAFTAASNVTGVITPYGELAKVLHKHNGYCFVDFSACAPYVEINMHPADEAERLDAIFMSPHKFLGGPGSSGIVIFNRGLYQRSQSAPDHPGGGTVLWTNPWGEKRYIEDIERREDGGTPGFMQAIRTALALRLKEQMGIDAISAQEKRLTDTLIQRLSSIPNVHILDGHLTNRIGIVSFYMKEISHNLVVRLLNDRYGIQARGGCSCAGTYGHYLLGISRSASKAITDRIDTGELGAKPGWIRLSLHPTMTIEEIHFIAEAVRNIAAYASSWANEYVYDRITGIYRHPNEPNMDIAARFEL